MNDTSREEKAALRHRIRDELNRLTPGARAAASACACSRLVQKQIWREARSVLLYIPLRDELDVEPLLQDALAAAKELALPYFDSQSESYLARRVLDFREHLQPGRFGIAEPKEGCPEVPLKRLDFILAPGVAFTADGRRLGRGKGFYDRLLASVCGIKCGIAFDEQIVDDIPAEPHDIRVDCVSTPARWIGVGQGVVLK